MFDFGFLPKGIVLKKLIWLKASGIVGAAYQTFTGAIARFLSPSSKPVKSIVCNIEPVQDLHGYDNPWPAGGGKNKFQITQTAGTVGDVTFAVETDNSGNVTGLKASGSISANANITVATAVISEAGNYKFSGLSTGSASTAVIQLRDASDNIISTRATDESGDLALSPGTYTCVLRVLNGATLTNLEVKPMLRLSSSASGFSPYSNLCPISGFTGLNVYGESEYDPTADPKVAVTWQSAAGTVYAGYISIDKDGNCTLTGTHKYLLADGVNVKVTGGYGAGGPEWLPAIVLSAADYVDTSVGSTGILSNYLVESMSIQTKENTLRWGNSGHIIVLHIGTMQGTDGTHGYNSASEVQSAVNAYLANNNLQILYKLASPVTYTLSSVTVPSTVQGENNWWHDANGNITIEAIGTPISSDEPDALQSLNILLGGAYTPRANFSEPTDEQALNIIMGGSR